MTKGSNSSADRYIIPYQELLGNYDLQPIFKRSARIIPYQELLGNYDFKVR